MNRFLTAVLAGIVLLQMWTLQRQSELLDRLQDLRNQQNVVDSNLRSDMNNLQGRLNEMADADRWMAVQAETVTPTATCYTADARVQWELRQWAQGTTSRLLYRTDASQPWQEAKVESMGGQNYAAAFTVPARPTIEARTSFFRENGSSSASEGRARTTAAKKPELDGQYQILAEGPQGSRSSGVRNMPLTGRFSIPVIIRGQENRGNNYEVQVSVPYGEKNNCTQIADVTVRAYAGDRLVETRTLPKRSGEEYVDTWKSAEPLTRLEVRLRHGAGEEEVRLDL